MVVGFMGNVTGRGLTVFGEFEGVGRFGVRSLVFLGMVFDKLRLYIQIGVIGE